MRSVADSNHSMPIFLLCSPILSYIEVFHCPVVKSRKKKLNEIKEIWDKYGTNQKYGKFEKYYSNIMATVNYRVRSATKGRLASVYLRFKDGISVDISVPTSFMIFPDYWNNEAQAFKQRIVFTDNFTEKDKNNLDEGFLDLRNTVLKKYNQLSVAGKEPTKEWLTAVIDEYHNRNSQSTETLNTFIAKFINEIESGERHYDHNNKVERYKPGTIRTYKGFQEQFNKFQDDKGKKFDFDDITMDLYDQLVTYFNKKEYSPNTIGKHIKVLKVIMRAARDQGLHKNSEIDRKKFKSMKVPVSNIYLTESELEKLAALDLSEKKEMDIARDVFLIGCYTAQRFSDYSRINKDNIRELNNGEKVIEIIQKKTGEQVLIPMKPELVTLLEKYDYTVPKIFEQKLNKSIKIIAADAKITAPVVKEVIRGGLKVSATLPKNKLIMTHTARRTGCTNMYLAKVNVLDIMKISGHKTEREFLSYIKVTKEETAQALTSHPYFTGTKLKAV